MAVQYLLAILFAVTFGLVEQYIFRMGFTPRKNFLRYFDRIYHPGILVLLILVVYPFLQLLPLLVVIEDISFFLFHPEARLRRSSWINLNLGGFSLFGQWIPTVYLLLIGGYALLEVFL
mgnify:CR=1 FL=1